MPFQLVTCPSCKNEIQIPTDQAKIHCVYCGTQLDIKDLASSGMPDPQNVLETAIQFLESNNFKEADGLLTKVLEYNPNSSVAWFGKALVSSSPQIEFKVFGSSVMPVLSQNIVQTESYIVKALQSPVESEIFRKKLAKLFLAVAMMRIKGFRGARLIDSAQALSDAVRGSSESLKLEYSIDACSWLNMGALALTASYALEPSQEIAQLLSYSYGVLWALPYIIKGWSAIDGCEAMLSLERKIRADHPDWTTRPTRPTRPPAQSTGCTTVLLLFLFCCFSLEFVHPRGPWRQRRLRNLAGPSSSSG